MMKKNYNFYVLLLIPLMLPMIVACSSDDEPKAPTITLTSANLTEDGYFDGVMYYKIISNSP